MPIIGSDSSPLSDRFLFFVFKPGDALSPVEEFSEFELCLAENDARGLIAYEDPRKVIARSMEDSSNPNHGLQHWVQDAHQIVRLIRKRREKLLIVERTNALREWARQSIAQFFLQTISIPYSAVAETDIDPLTRMMCDFSILTHPAANRLFTEIQASASVSAGDYPPTSWNVAQISSELGAIRRDRAEKEMLLRQVIQLQTSLRKADESKATELKNQMQQAQEENNALKASTSWRITAPLRAVGRLIAR